MNIHALSGIQTRDSSSQVAAELRLIPHCHHDRRVKTLQGTVKVSYSKLEYKK
jgi:hypothetical protein